jgi:hypothetical protein
VTPVCIRVSQAANDTSNILIQLASAFTCDLPLWEVVSAPELARALVVTWLSQNAIAVSWGPPGSTALSCSHPPQESTRMPTDSGTDLTLAGQK